MRPRASYVGQLRALAWLWLQSTKRRSFVAGGAPQITRVPKLLLLGIVFEVYYIGFISSVGRRVAGLKGGHLSGLRFLCWGLFFACASGGFVYLSPQIGKMKTLWRSSFLELLPISPSVWPPVIWLQSHLFVLMGPVLLYTARRPPLDAHLGLVALVSLLLGIAGSLFGQSVYNAMRVLVPGFLRRASQPLAFVALISAFPFIISAPGLGVMWKNGGHDPFFYIARGLDGEAISSLGIVAALLALIAILLGVLRLCERAGYDREDRPASSKFRGAALRSPVRAELRMQWRQGGMKGLLFIQLVLIASAIAALLFGSGLLVHAKKDAELIEISLGFLAYSLFMTVFVVLNLATQATTRDLGARPFLAALPITPAQVLARLAQSFRVIVAPTSITLLLAVPLLLVFPLPADVGISAIPLRILLLTLGLQLVCAIAPAVAFLTRGLGAQGASGGGMPSPIVSVLILMPLFAIVGSPSWAQSVVALLMLAALAYEADRSAQRCVSWIDDGDQSLRRETPVWRALLTLGGYFTAQALAMRLTAFLPIDDGLRMALGMLLAQALLVVLSLRARPRVAVRAPSPAWDGLGFLAGAASGGLALLMMLALRKLGVHLDTRGGEISHLGMAALSFVMVIGAPLAEEPFFRGWLQAAIGRELPRARAWLAPLVAALAFAGVHMGSLVLPQLVLGLVAGILFQRTERLRPGIVAHMAHNAIVIPDGS